MSAPHPRDDAGSEPAAKRERREEDAHAHHAPSASSSHSAAPGAEKSLQKLVAAHYDSRPSVSVQGRQESIIFHLRNLNNWVKSVLIARVTGAGDYIFDICGGKGGDLKKWQQGRVNHVVLADHAAKSVDEARHRYNQMSARFSAQFIVADCFKALVTERLPPGLVFDVVSCQFALHYSFESETRARRFLENVSSRLQPKGAFIATIPDAVRIVKRMRELPADVNEFGNSIYTVQFSQGKWAEPPVYGAEYLFTLKDAVDKCPEWLVHLSALEKLAQEFELELEATWLFDEFFAEFSKRHDNAQLLHRMQALNSQGTISPEEWEAATLYRVVVFRKRANAKRPSTLERPKFPAKAVPADAILKVDS